MHGLEELVSNPTFTVGDRVIENVEKWSHLGHIINTNFNDNDGIELRKNCFIGKVNKILVHFSKLDPFTTNRLFKIFCSSYYGCELWDLNVKKIGRILCNMAKGSKENMVCALQDSE